MYYTYILLLKNGDLYKGSTADLAKRVNQHKQDRVASTKNKMPMLVHYECYLEKSDAERREKFLKTTEGKRLLRQQIRDFLNKVSIV
ncbi:MAG: GIY-YIG nuclease family protein [Candidatus Magasanikbacteria bacterium]|nr:GIY-YIG nuclease family protein [Candidatus Magasanikbacteria bacterium]